MGELVVDRPASILYPPVPGAAVVVGLFVEKGTPVVIQPGRILGNGLHAKVHKVGIVTGDREVQVSGR